MPPTVCHLGLATLSFAAALVAPTRLAAQGDFRGDVLAGVPGRAVHKRDFRSGQFSLSASSGGAGAAISANGRTGRMGILATTEARDEAAQGTLTWTTELVVTRTSALGALQPFQIYLDGTFGRTPYNVYAGRAGATASLVAYVSGDYNPYNGGVRFAPERVPSDGSDGGPAKDERGSTTVWVPIAAGLPGSTARIALTYQYQVHADYGWDADFSHTARLFVPTVAGLTWRSDDGTLSEQARPTWAANDRVTGEVGVPPVTTTPEPATFALVGVGALGLAGAARRRAPEGRA